MEFLSDGNVLSAWNVSEPKVKRMDGTWIYDWQETGILTWTNRDEEGVQIQYSPERAVWSAIDSSGPQKMWKAGKL